MGPMHGHETVEAFHEPLEAEGFAIAGQAGSHQLSVHQNGRRSMTPQ